MTAQVIAVDLARVYRSPSRRGYITTLAWGDPVDVVQTTNEFVEVVTTQHRRLPDGSVEPHQETGFIVPTRSSGLSVPELTMEPDRNDVLRVDFVDVQQGDGAVIETPQGKIVLIDGGEPQLFARYLANRFRGSSAAAPQKIDCILVSHGDADHFAGLTKIHESETHSDHFKRLFIHPARVYHNGLVKRPEKNGGVKRKETELLGPTKKVGTKTYLTGLEGDLLAVPDAEMNSKFLEWKAALTAFRDRGGPIEFRRLQKGDDDAFDFLATDRFRVEVLAPIVEQVDGHDALLFLGNPPAGPRIRQESLSVAATGFAGKSASHTINGHSIVLRITYGNVRFLFAGDLNDQAERTLTKLHADGGLDLTSEVLKVPHHGSADFSGAFLRAVSPVISVVSSGDENARVEYVHPRSTLMGSLGKHSRLDEPLIFVTELVAFFRTVGYVSPEFHRLDDAGVAVIRDGQVILDPEAAKRFFAFQRDAWGIVRVRTNGSRLFVYTDSGKSDLKEAYAFTVDADVVTPTNVLQA